MLALARTSGAIMALFNASLRHRELSATGRQALAVLDGAGQPMSPTAISERLLVTTASMTSLLDTLERRGLVIRQPDPDDRRKQLVSLTRAGQQVVDEFLPEVVALQTAMMTGLNEADRRQLVRLLGVIREALADIDADAVVAAAPPRGKRRRD